MSCVTTMPSPAVCQSYQLRISKCPKNGYHTKYVKMVSQVAVDFNLRFLTLTLSRLHEQKTLNGFILFNLSLQDTECKPTSSSQSVSWTNIFAVHFECSAPQRGSL